MTTPSGITPQPESPDLERDHWNRLSQRLSTRRTEEFGTWIDRELSVLEDRLDEYVSANSLLRSLRR